MQLNVWQLLHQECALRKLLKTIFSVECLGYISHCSPLTHMFIQPSNMLHRPSSSSPLLTSITPAGWPNHLWQAGSFRTALCGSIEPYCACQTGMVPLHKRTGTHRSLISATSCCCLFRLHMLPVSLSLCLWLLNCCSRRCCFRSPGPVGFKLWDALCFLLSVICCITC